MNQYRTQGWRPSFRRARFTLLWGAALLAAGCAADAPEASFGRMDEPILGGTLDEQEDYPSIVLVFNDIDDGSGDLCTGTLISKNIVLTARHCVSHTTEAVDCEDDIDGDYLPWNLYVLKGHDPVHDKGAYLGRGRQVFHDGSTSLCGHDLALILLGSAIYTIAPSPVQITKGPGVGDLFTSVGFGLTNPEDFSTAGRRFFRHDVKVTALGSGLDANDFEGTLSVCQGDSGGPALADSWAVMGVASRGQECIDGVNYWTRTDRFRDLIERAVGVGEGQFTGDDGVRYPARPTNEKRALQVGLACADNSGCPLGLQCANDWVGKSCTLTCTPTSCPAGYSCNTSTNLCAKNVGCNGPQDCAPGTACVTSGEDARQCRLLCGRSEHCPVGQQCDVERRVCQLPNEQGGTDSEDEGCTCRMIGSVESEKSVWARWGALIGLGLTFVSRRRRRCSRG